MIKAKFVHLFSCKIIISIRRKLFGEVDGAPPMTNPGDWTGRSRSFSLRGSFITTIRKVLSNQALGSIHPSHDVQFNALLHFYNRQIIPKLTGDYWLEILCEKCCIAYLHNKKN